MHDELQVGSWTVRPQLNEITAGEECRRLTPKAMAVLLCLARRPAAVVTREQLVAEVWDGASITDDALSTVVYELRRAFEDDGRNSRTIETIRKSGYRLIAPVVTVPEVTVPEVAGTSEAPEVAGTSEAPEAAGTSGPPEAAGTSGPPEAAGTSGRRWRWWGLLGLAAVAVMAVLLGRGTGQAPAEEIASLAVLPITTLDLDGRPDRVADALTEMLIADVAQICPQRVAPGIAVRGPQRWDLRRAAEELAVDAVVEGTLLRSGDRLWISVQLVDTQTGRMLWGGSFERELGDELPSLRQLAQDIAVQIRLNVAPEPMQTPALPLVPLP